MEIPRLHPDTIEAVRQQADIVEVVSERVVLRKRGKDYLGLCPFHEEKTPSFSVSPSKQLYYCFGCGAGGNVFKFLMELGKQSFSDVVLDLAKRYQVPIQTLEPKQQQEFQRQLTLREQLFEILAVAASFYQHTLRQSEGEVALEYLKSERQLSDETIQAFQLGYAPAGWETLYRYLVEQKRYSLALVEETGLIQKRKSGSGYYDRFRDRLMIPIHDTQGRVIGFGSRTLANEEPKYLNSPQTPLFDKSKTLFALDKARNAISQKDQAVVVEGYFDAIALHAAGITNAVASLGTAFTQDQLRRLLRYTESKHVVLNFDADTAGTTATQRAIAEIEPLVYSGQVQLRVLNLPGGKDADEFLKSATDAVEEYRQRIKDAPLWIDWQLDQLLIGQDLKHADRFGQVAAQMVKLLDRIADANQRTHYIRHCAELLSQGDARLIPLYSENLVTQLKALRRPNRSHQPVQISQNSPTNLLAKAEELLLRIYLHCPGYRQEIQNGLEEKDLLFSLSHYRFLWQQILALEETFPELIYDGENRLLALLNDRLSEFPEQMNQLTHLFHLDEKQLQDISRPMLVLRAAIATLEQVACEKRRRYCLEQWQQLDPNTEAGKRQYYYQEFYETQRRIQELKAQRQFSILEILDTPPV